MLTPEEQERYDRQIKIKGIGEAGQEKLKQAKVIVVGSGGLGAPAAIYLAAAGVGTIGIVDYDRVELSNLNRQILHWDSDIGRSKVDSAVEKLSQLNPDVKIEAIEETVSEANVSRLLAGFDLVVDGLDNLSTRYLLNKAAIESNIPLVHGTVYGLEGRAMTVIPGKTACLRCVYRGLIPPGKCPAVGVIPAVIGCIQATEAIKYIMGIGKLLTNRLLLYDGLNMNFTELVVKRDPNCEHCGHLMGEE
ncbi:MAG: HesA/MoeB/ThiF family protein [Chloroflexi bacterium]|nr:HesA/MoeB/ThiF family protein [Chloroflexota bacterium]